MYKYELAPKIESICVDMEIYFRFKQKLHSDNKIWIEIIENN